MKKALTLVVLMVTPPIMFAQGTFAFANGSRELVQRWTSASDSSLGPVPVGGGYVELIAAPRGTPLLHPLGVYDGSSGFLPGFSSVEGFLAANPGWAVPYEGSAMSPIWPVPGRFNGGVYTLRVPEGGDADYVVIGWTGPYATYDAAYAADLANPTSSFLGMSAIATTHTGDPYIWPTLGPGWLGTTFQGMTLAPALIPEPITVLPAGQAGDYTYTTNNGNITITGYTGSGGAVTIPDNINGLAVTGIGMEAFYNRSSLSSVTIPNGVTSIGVWAFLRCTCLTNITIPDSVTSIGDSAFASCSSLTNVTIPSAVTNIGDFAFASCTSMAAIKVDALNPVYSSFNGVLFDKAQTTLLQCPGGATASFGIPNTVSSIRYSAFNACARLISIMIPNSVTSIGDNAFGGCASLGNVTIPDSVIHIGNGAFAGCTSLTTATIGRRVTDIGASAFAYCQSLTNVTVGQSVSTIGALAFSWFTTTSLTGVYFSGNAPTLGGGWGFNWNYSTIYYLPGTTGWGSSFGGSPTALWVLPYPIILTTAPSFGIHSNRFGFIISWATNVPVVVEACTSLANPAWSPVATNTLAGGWAYFSDPAWTNYPGRFYRTRSP
jgi:hypothetical protein